MTFAWSTGSQIEVLGESTGIESERFGEVNDEGEGI